ncbi:putative restriction endonuclease [Gemmobacter aquatilis]|uniref:Putative restriction endonuclease n=1 Tax=Gemmobacter aquatilis TaxID=933059 RepID=A0A1H8DRB8_9RHOB|nr:HNH endonuclease signature motif containing protein [Gemmobacter aquatilis]SEN09404.1 putative restriction endonuclease [Gemmobacter aquatilis]
MAERRNWTEAEVRAALALYLVTEFGRFHSRNPDIIRLAARLGRTAAAVALKLTNLAALDDSLPQKGMANASATDRRVWAEYLRAPEAVIAAYAQQSAAPMPGPGLAEAAAAFDHRGGGVRDSVVQTRVGQDLFRRTILTSYRNRCALTGIDDPRLLTASHILPWAEAPEMRMRPTNGICLNALHDRAFDRHLITFGEDWRMIVSPHLSADSRAQLVRGVDQPLEMPARFAPDAGFMQAHRQRFASA